MKVEHTPERIVECVNAFEGIENPKEFMEVVKQLKLDDYQEVAKERDRYKAALMDIDQLRPINQERTIVCFGIAKNTAHLALNPELF